MRRIIETEMWNDNLFRKEIKDNDERIVFVYLLTSPQSKLCGIYHLPLDLIAYHTGLTQDFIVKTIEKFMKLNIVRYNFNTEEVAIANYLKYNVNRGGTPIEQAIERQLGLVKDRELIKWVYDYYLEKEKHSLSNLSLEKVLSILKKSINILVYITDTQSDTESDTLKTQKEVSDDDLKEQLQNALNVIKGGN